MDVIKRKCYKKYVFTIIVLNVSIIKQISDMCLKIKSYNKIIVQDSVLISSFWIRYWLAYANSPHCVFVSVNDEKVSDGEQGCERAKLAFNCYVENYKEVWIWSIYIKMNAHFPWPQHVWMNEFQQFF